jgi:hypothetical protein
MTTQELQVLHGVRATQGEREHMIVLEIKLAATLHALTAIPLEDRTTDLTRDRFPARPRGLPVAFLSVQQHARPVQALRRPALPVSDQRENIPLTVAA